MSDDIYINGEYFKNNPTWDQEDSLWKSHQISKMLDKHEIIPQRLAEIGCGAGEILNQLHIRYENTDFFGYEVSPQAISLCEEKAKPRLLFSLENILEDDESHFDVIMAIDVFEHVDDYLGFIKSMRNKGDYKIFHIPLDMNVASLLRNQLMKQRETVGHLHYFNKDTALATLETAGCKVVDFRYTGSVADFETSGVVSKALNALRRVAFKISPDWAVKVLGGYSLLVLAK